MTAMTRSLRSALADLARTLSHASTGVETVLLTAATATADLIGDAAGIALLRDDRRYGALTLHHPDPELVVRLAEALDREGTPPADDHSTAMMSTRLPVVLSPLPAAGAGRHLSAAREMGARAAMLCPIVVDDAYLGYLILLRIAGDGAAQRRYDDDDVDLVRFIAGEVGLALSAAQRLERLRASDERYRRVLESITEGVLQLDQRGLITYANEPAGVMLGLPNAQLIGVSLGGFLDSRGQADLARRLTDSAVGRATVGATRLLRADGSQRSGRISIVPLPDDHGQSGTALCMITDTTDKIDTRSLKRQLDHLRRLDSLGQLIGGIAHDFNNLLTVVAGSADMLAMSADPESAEHRCATDIVRAVAAGRALTHQLLAFGRSDGNRREDIPVVDLLNDLQSLFSRTLGEHIGLELVFSPDTWPVRAERGPLEQALVNLAANARDAMRHGGVVRATAENIELRPGDLPGSALSGRVVHLVISDTGAGMTEETRQRAFEPFFTTRPTSAGLGLATTAGIVRGIGGEITLESQPRMGTSVHLYLPTAGPAAAGPHPARPANPQAVCNVLIVEDQPDLAAVVQRLVEPAGYAVTVCTDPREAVAQVAAGTRPDLLITDVVMPAMTGPELAAALRRHQPDLPVVFTSGYTAAALGPQIDLDPNSVLVEKPFTRMNLMAAISHLCGR
jgi:two-component system, cell cycle sensor histidine kinase and response regulator CckA